MALNMCTTVPPWQEGRTARWHPASSVIETTKAGCPGLGSADFDCVHGAGSRLFSANALKTLPLRLHLIRELLHSGAHVVANSGPIGIDRACVGLFRRCRDVVRIERFTEIENTPHALKCRGLGVQKSGICVHGCSP